MHLSIRLITDLESVLARQFEESVQDSFLPVMFEVLQVLNVEKDVDYLLMAELLHLTNWESTTVVRYPQ